MTSDELPPDLIEVAAQATALDRSNPASLVSPIGRAVTNYLLMARLIEELEADLKIAKARFLAIESEELPSLLDSEGVASMVLSNGTVVKLDQDIKASLAGAKDRAVAIAWLRETGNDALVTGVVSVTFGRGEDNACENFHQWLLAYHPERQDRIVKEESVNTTSFKSVVRETFARGETIPEGMGVFIRRIAKVKPPKPPFGA